MEIRLLKGEDYPALYALWQSVPGMGLNSADDTETGIQRFLARNPDTCFAAEENGQLIGAIMAGYDGRRAVIYHTAVAKDYQSRGIGSALVETLLNKLKEKEITKVFLVVFKHNEAGNAFWQSNGFYEREDLCYRDMSLTEMERYDT